MKWQPLQPATITDPVKRAEAEAQGWESWVNNQYQVLKRTFPSDLFGQVIHLSIRRQDRAPARDWRHFQKMKNQLAGPEWEGVELYPAESRLVDEANQYHIWCVNGTLPFGFADRSVGGPDEAAKVGGKQRAFDDEEISG